MASSVSSTTFAPFSMARGYPMLQAAFLALIAAVPLVAMVSGLFIASVLGLLGLMSALMLSSAGMQQRVPYGFMALAAGFMIYAGFSVLWAADQRAALRCWQHIALMSGGGLLLWIALPNLAPAQARRFYRAASLSVIAASLVMLLSAWNGFSLSRSAVALFAPQQEFTIAMHNRFATVLALLIWPLLGAGLAAKDRLGLIAAVCAALAVMWLDSLAATVSLAVGFVMFAIGLWRMVVARWLMKAAWIMSAIGMVLYFGPVYEPPAPEVLVAEIDNLSAVHRIYIWDFVANAAFEHLPFGAGIGAARSLPGGDDVIYRGLTYVPSHPHNQVLQVTLELGLPGLLILLAMGFWLIRCAGQVQGTAAERAASLATVAAYCTIGGISYSAWQSWWLAAAFLTAAWVRLLCHQTPGSACGRAAV